jgi:glycine cleavage system H lipoate-binding protein
MSDIEIMMTNNTANEPVKDSIIIEGQQEEIVQEKKKQRKIHEKQPKPPRLLILPNLLVKECNRENFLSLERRFKSLYYVKQDEWLLKNELVVNAMILDNNIALFILPFPVISVEEFQFSDAYLDVSISGKHKRGAKSVDAGNVFGTIKANSQQISLIAPISGKIMEINERLIANPTVLSTNEYRCDGYLMVLSTEAPKIIENNALLVNSNIPVHLEDKICFAWLKGKCARGNDCKFLHSR